jgi:hypothetical protein
VQERHEYAERFEEAYRLFICPSCGHEFRPTDALSVFNELYDLLARHCRGDHIDQMVGGLLRYEGETRDLIGITADTARAVFLEPERETVVAVRFDSHGVRDRIEATLMREETDAESWIAFHIDDLLWTHPRYGIIESTTDE